MTLSARPAPLTDMTNSFRYAEDRIAALYSISRRLEQSLACAVEVLIDLEHNVSRINRYRDAERHPDVGIALTNARTAITVIKAYVEKR